MFNTQTSKVGNQKKYASLKWKCVTTEAPTHTKFEQVWTDLTIEEGPMLMFVTGKANGKSYTVGAFSAAPLPTKPSPIAQDETYHIPMAQDSFSFIYQGDSKLNHFTPNGDSSDPFGYVITDYQKSGAFAFMNEFILIAYSQEFCSILAEEDTTSLIKCVENPGYNEFIGDYSVEKIEFWIGVNPKEDEKETLAAINANGSKLLFKEKPKSH